MLAALSWQSCPGVCVPAVLSWESSSAFPLLPVPFWPSRCPLAILFYLPCSGFPILLVMLCPGRPVLVLSVMAILFYLSFCVCPVLGVLFLLSSPFALSWLYCPDCSALAILFWQPCSVNSVWSCFACPVPPIQFRSVLFCLSCSACSVLPVHLSLSDSACTIMPVLQYYACPVLHVQFWLSFFWLSSTFFRALAVISHSLAVRPVLAACSPVLAVPILTVLFFLSCSVCPHLPVHLPVLVLPVLFC